MKRFLVFILALFFCMPANIAFAAEAVPLNDSITDNMISTIHVYPSATAGRYEDYSYNILDSRNGLYIVDLSQMNGFTKLAEGVGVIDVPNKKVILPFKYYFIQFTPDGKMLVGERPGDVLGVSGRPYNGPCYNYTSDASGNLTPVNIDGWITGVDSDGYVTLTKYIEVSGIDTEQPTSGKIEVPVMALLDNHYNMILGYIMDGLSGLSTPFQDDLAIKATGATKYYIGSQFNTSNAKYGVINRQGQFVIPPDYYQLTYLGNGKFDSWSGPTPQTETEEILDINDFISKPSSWAAADVASATSLGLVPQSFFATPDIASVTSLGLLPQQPKYTQPATRAQFCALAVALYEKISGEITGLKTFTDTTDINVEKAAYIGVVYGTNSDGTLFAPDAQLTREQAATMLSRLAGVIGKPLADQPMTFADSGSVSSWASEAVGQMQATGIMNGVGNNMFSPKYPYTREQSIITVLRLYNAVK